MSKATPEEVLSILKREVSLTGSNPVHFQTSLRNEAGLDSLDLSLFLLAVQEHYDIKIADDNAEKLDSIDDVVHWINQS
jgi:acyl carrier protein